MVALSVPEMTMHMVKSLDAPSSNTISPVVIFSRFAMAKIWAKILSSRLGSAACSACWAASSDLDNIWTHPSSNAQLVISGGTIYNAGAEGGDCAHDQCNGITVNGGSFVLSGVEVRNNKGYGVWTPSAKVTGFVINGCRVFGNGRVGARLSGSNFAVTGNVFFGNSGGNLKLDSPSDAHVVANNVGV